MKRKKEKVCIAMSGGIDSSVAAAILKKQGYDCVGIFMKFWSDQEGTQKVINKCCSIESFETARKVSHQLNFPIYTLNFKQPFKKQVVDDFLSQFQSGLTPNPCINCNKFIKFDLLWQKARVLGCNYLATGHYIKKTTNQLLRAKDKNKDQSYFLYNLKQSQLKHLLFPLGNYTKTQVRAMAKKWNLPAKNRPESQEICFVSGKSHNEFLKHHLKLKPGSIVTTQGKTVGQHKGLPLYTLGQRKGIKVGGIGPFYVVKMNYKTNTLIVSEKKDDSLLYHKIFRIKNTNWINGKPRKTLNCEVKIRHQAPSVKCKIINNQVTLSKPLRAITPGQSAVFYKNQQLLGGGVIDKTF
ncbi:MAG: tRNA 2-thiouridine(34) synthase MnmA [Candidatus Buchananbacteria bacterium RIFCSPHIGHO2_02_FULL_38_8]|uniref:tRNA-specific 2-thiouridylase MnmA n=1 Tax=Candidatus Buchananbacteria bacterium RIFCSPHIGHO2_02_FULL_38_8 TaxID=1797538 RepID=A0A1G1Y3M9_9BACT|nr:hypothetical protein [uncultured bacterium]OGY46794.1 MAG: tRNA 2-thiouridine(34) synthase MnmA [Candidatus Buchananbacteria bacterium RIFCSPHIGHO2_02_FULL_38_8]